MAETLFGLLLVLGWKTRLTPLLSGVRLTAFALSMTPALGVKALLNYSVFSAAGGALLLATYTRIPFSLDEFVFVPRNKSSAEDDGWILSLWYDPTVDRSELVIQDARDFSGETAARVKLNHRVPYGFHGNWVPAKN